MDWTESFNKPRSGGQS